MARKTIIFETEADRRGFQLWIKNRFKTEDRCAEELFRCFPSSDPKNQYTKIYRIVKGFRRGVTPDHLSHIAKAAGITEEEAVAELFATIAEYKKSLKNVGESSSAPSEPITQPLGVLGLAQSSPTPASNQSIELVHTSGDNFLQSPDFPSTMVQLESKHYYRVLTEIVTGSAERKPLYVSVGTGDFVSPWIRRTCSDQTAPVQISDLVIVRLSDEVLASYLSKKLLDPEFLQKLTSNIRDMKTDSAVRKMGITVVERYWPHVSPFHGYLYGNRMLLGRWEVDEKNYFHVRTPLHDGDADHFPELFRQVSEAFKTALLC